VIVQVSATTQPAGTTAADTVAVGIFEGDDAPRGLPGEATQLLASGEARGTPKALAVAHADGKRWLLVGLGKRADFTPERARAAAAGAQARALELATRTLCWQVPDMGTGASADASANTGTGASTGVGVGVGTSVGANTGTGVGTSGYVSGDKDGREGALAVCAALVEGTALADYRFDRHRSTSPEAEDSAPKHLEALILSAPDGVSAQDLERTAAAAAVVAESVNAARDLQNRPANDLTPTALAEYARALAQGIEGLTVEVEGRAGILARGMGAFAAVAQGSEQEPVLITLRYDGPPTPGGAANPGGPVLGLVGKAVTFDSGGISLKPGAKMAEMKFDMSGGAAVLEAVGAIAKLKLPVRLVGVVGATENLPSGRSVKPGDIVTAANGKTVEVNNTDAEGRLVLADCLHHAVSLGAERLVDLATLTGAVIIALGSTYAGLISNDDELAGRIAAAGEQSGEIVWRLPLHKEYDELIKGTYGDLDNAPEGRKAGTIVGGAFLSNFVGETPWAHLDIAGSAWDLGRAYAPKGASGYGVRLLVELARSYTRAS
jgi:leucyl aminopeptidase